MTNMSIRAIITFILTGLRANIARIAPRAPAQTPDFDDGWECVSRACASLERLFALWRNGTLPGAHAPKPCPEPRPASLRPRLPQGPASLHRPLGDDHTTGNTSRSRCFRDDAPEVRAAGPQAARILRPPVRRPKRASNPRRRHRQTAPPHPPPRTTRRA